MPDFVLRRALEELAVRAQLVVRASEPQTTLIGLNLDLRLIKDLDRYFNEIVAPGNRSQVFTNGWISDFPAPGGFIEPLFRCAAPANGFGLCDPTLDRAIDRAYALQPRDPSGANSRWAAIDRRLVDRAYVVPLANLSSSYVFSERVKNVQIHPQWGLLLSRVWLR